VYGIISAQLVLTALVAGTILAVEPVRNFVTHSLAFQLTCAILPLVGAHSFQSPP
jgi:FtsH-binding integral membrane protein